MFQAYACDAVSGRVIDRVAVASFTWEQLLSAKGSGTVSFPLDGTYTKAQLRDLTQHWARIWALEYDGRLLYMGYVSDRGYTYGKDSIELGLSDLWAMLARRGAWNHSAANVNKWKQTVAGSLAQHAAEAILRGRDTGPALPDMNLPLTIPGFGGTSVSRTYYGYHLQTIEDVLSGLLDEGLDITFDPRWIDTGDADWLMQAGPAWTRSGTPAELYVTAPLSAVSGFQETGDGSRVTNSAYRVGEGSEEDMLVRSNRATASPYPLLNRVTSSKQVKNVGQLSAQASQDLQMYAAPTFQWEFDVHLNQGIQVGDVVRLHFDGDPWIADGWHERRVVKVSGSMSEFMRVAVQATGGA